MLFWARTAAVHADEHAFRASASLTAARSGGEAGRSEVRRAGDLAGHRHEQHFKLVKAFTVAENVHLGRRDLPRHLTQAELIRRTAALAEQFALPVKPDALVRDLSAVSNSGCPAGTGARCQRC